MKVTKLAVPRFSTWVILFSAIVLTSIGQIYIKLGAIQWVAWEVFAPQLVSLQLTKQTQGMLLSLSLGMACYFVSMLLWMYVLSFLKLSRAYPLLSIAYILVYIGAVQIPELKEQFSFEKNLGILIILVGVVVVTLPSKSKN